MKLLLVVLIFLALVCAAKSLLSVNPSETTLSSSVSSVQASRLSSNFVVGNDSPGLIEKQNSVSYESQPTQFPTEASDDSDHSSSESSSKESIHQPAWAPVKSPTTRTRSYPPAAHTSALHFQPTFSPNPSKRPNRKPSGPPSVRPSVGPTVEPTLETTFEPSLVPSGMPTVPSSSEVNTATESPPPTSYPTARPSGRPSSAPSIYSKVHSINPSSSPTVAPSERFLIDRTETSRINLPTALESKVDGMKSAALLPTKTVAAEPPADLRNFSELNCSEIMTTSLVIPTREKFISDYTSTNIAESMFAVHAREEVSLLSFPVCWILAIVLISLVTTSAFNHSLNKLMAFFVLGTVVTFCCGYADCSITQVVVHSLTLFYHLSQYSMRLLAVYIADWIHIFCLIILLIVCGRVTSHYSAQVWSNLKGTWNDLWNWFRIIVVPAFHSQLSLLMLCVKSSLIALDGYIGQNNGCNNVAGSQICSVGEEYQRAQVGKQHGEFYFESPRFWDRTLPEIVVLDVTTPSTAVCDRAAVRSDDDNHLSPQTVPRESPIAFSIPEFRQSTIVNESDKYMMRCDTPLAYLKEENQFSNDVSGLLKRYKHFQTKESARDLLMELIKLCDILMLDSSTAPPSDFLPAVEAIAEMEDAFIVNARDPCILDCLLHVLCRLGHVDAVRKLLGNPELKVDQLDEQLCTSLTIVAMTHGNVDIARALVERGANCHLRNEQGFSAWNYAEGRNENLLDVFHAKL